MNAFEYAHKQLEADITSLLTNCETFRQEIRMVAYDQILCTPIVRVLASREIGYDFDHSWSADDVPKLIQLLRSDVPRTRGAAALLVGRLWTVCEAQGRIHEVATECLSMQNQNSEDPMFGAKVELWLDCIKSKACGILSELAFED